MQQKVTKLCVRDLFDANRELKQLTEMNPRIKFNANATGKCITICSFSDASFNITAFQSYGQTGIISGLEFDTNRERRRIFHPIDWTSCKQRRVSHSSYGAERLACADADDRGFYVEQAVQSIFVDMKIKQELNVDYTILSQYYMNEESTY